MIAVKHDEAKLHDLGGGTTRRILSWSDDLMTVEVGFDAGAEGQAHSHPHTQCSYVLAGKFTYTVDGETVTLEKGDSVIVPGGKIHGTRCLEAGVLLDIFTPARQDFLRA